jgi:excisionase family DNA binding protein
MNRPDQAVRIPDTSSRNRAATLITAAELARLMQISQRTVWRLVSADRIIPPIRIGGNTRWRLDEVERWIVDGCPPSAESSE